MQSDSNSAVRVIRSLASALRNTPLHPQWFACYRERQFLKSTCSGLRGRVLDVGCAGAKPRRELGADVDYIGIDLPLTATGWYHTRPDVFADAQELPFIANCIDHCLLLDVLEHLPDPDRCLAAIHQVLKPGGTLTLQVPFLYPVHDAPLDYHRWTRFGLREAARRHGYHIADEVAAGHPLESAALTANIALSQTVLNWLAQKNPLALSGILLPFAVLAINSLAWLFARLSKADGLMPYAYRMTWVRE